MSKRKTFEVDAFREKVNRLLKLSADSLVLERLATASILEMVLQDTGNYKGYGYLQLTDPNLATKDIPAFQESAAFDNSRRFYY